MSTRYEIRRKSHGHWGLSRADITSKQQGETELDAVQKNDPKGEYQLVEITETIVAGAKQ